MKVNQAEFTKMIEYAKNGRLNGWDGLAEWNKVKTQFSDEQVGSWTGPILNEKYSKVRERFLSELPEYYEGGGMHAANHFLLQCLRISFKNKFTERRLIQIAYNIGQFKASVSEYNSYYVFKFYELGLDKIETYYK